MKKSEVEASTSKIDAYLANKNDQAIPEPQSDKNNAPVLAYDASGQPIIKHANGRYPEILDAVGQTLADKPELNIYVNSGRLVRLAEVKKKSKDIERPAGALVLHPIEAAHMVELMGIAARHQKYDLRVTDSDTGKKGTWVNCDCPRRVAEGYLSRPIWPELPELIGFVEAPTMDLDGRIIDEAGLDEKTGIYVTLLSEPARSQYKRPANRPSAKAGKEAAETLLELVETFPFVSDGDKSAIIAAIITAMIRRMLPAAPLFAITAPMAGTGKTLLAETPAIIATGREASVLSIGQDDAETEKRLGGALLAGDSVILLDNLQRPLDGDLLCQVTTQPIAKLRPLGGSRLFEVPTNALLLVDGNNLAIHGDLKRRTVLIRMDAKVERPEQRKFDRHHLDTVMSCRGLLISAALTIPKAYLAAGEPVIEGHIPFGSFEAWDRLVRRPLLWLGYPDPLGGAEALRDADPDLETMRAFFGSWIDIPGLAGPQTVSDIIKAGMEVMPGGDRACPDLHDALQLVCSEKVSGPRLGYWLRSHRDRIVDGIRLERVGEDTHAKVTRWQLSGNAEMRR